MIYECMYCEKEYRFTNEAPLTSVSHGICGQPSCLERLAQDVEVPISVLQEIIRQNIENNKCGDEDGKKMR